MNTMCTTSLVVSLLFFAATITTTISTDTQATESQLADISIRLYTGETIDEYVSVLVGNATNLLNYMNTSIPTVFYIFGWTETPESTSVQTMVGAYLERKGHNVILPDWEGIAAGSYDFAAYSADSVGSTIAQALNELVSAGVNPTTMHIVGHSLGAQVAGAVGRHVNFNLPRITGLDPAGPDFYTQIESLNSTDAEFVDVIHTDAGVYGSSESDGQVNFWPNNGTRTQPGCPTTYVSGSDDSFCNHRRSWYYYAESVRNETAFVAVQCDSNDLFESGSCSSNTQVVMGYATPPTVSGSFYLVTNSESPFGLGVDGIQ